MPAQRSAGAASPLSPAAVLVRRHDRDRYQTALFAPAARREALFALYAFNYEIARVRETVTEPTLGRIRLEWWRENIAACYDRGPVRHHPVAEALALTIRDRNLTRAHFDRLIDARETDFHAEPPATLAALEEYTRGTSSSLVLLALEALGVSDPAAAEAGEDIGVAYALAGLLRALPFQSALGRPVIPVEIAANTGLDPDVALQPSPALCAAVGEIAGAAARHLRQARSRRGAVRRAAIVALLPAVIADRSLKRLRLVGYDPFAPALTHPDPLQAWRLAAAVLRARF
ncbi:MAG TPA: phytoene/squalene synthase family protein [Stellaceae bacterium]